MTKKDFELIAHVLKARRSGADLFDAQLVDILAHEFADALRSTNKQFNRDKFLRACGVCPSKSI